MSRPLILIIDDESKIRRLVAANLELEGFDVVSAGDGQQGLEIFQRAAEKPDLILLDLMMPEMDGMTFLRKLRAFSNTPVIILSAKDERPTVIEGFRIGADDFIAKPFYLQELLERIRAVLRRCTRSTVPYTHADSQTLKSGKIHLQSSKRQCFVGETAVKLTDTEFRLLQELVRHEGEVLTHERLLRRVWGDEYTGEVQYLRVTFARIRRKLEAAGLDGGIISSYSSVGYILCSSEAD